MRVLVVDDDRDTVLSLSTLFRTEAHDVRGLYAAQDIEHHVAEFNPDVVILDIAMPGRSGWEAAEAIRAGPAAKKPVMIGLSGEYTSGAHRSAARARGFDYYLMKPCDPAVLMMLLKWLKIESPYRTALAR